MFSKGDNFHEFLFVYLEDEVFPNGVYSQRKEFPPTAAKSQSFFKSIPLIIQKWKWRICFPIHLKNSLSSNSEKARKTTAYHGDVLLKFALLGCPVCVLQIMSNRSICSKKNVWEDELIKITKHTNTNKLTDGGLQLMHLLTRVNQNLKIVSLIDYIVSEINILTKFCQTTCYSFIINCTSFEKMHCFFR